jgi:hypothetical protein
MQHVNKGPMLLMTQSLSVLDFSPPYSAHCNEIPIYVFFFWELRGLSPNFYIHVSECDLYISRICPFIFLQQNRQTDHGNI